MIPESSANRLSSALVTPLRPLLMAVALGGFAQSLAGSAGGLLAEEIAGSAATAGLPQSMLVLGSAVGALGISRVSARAGRGAALSAGAVLGTCGCALVVVGAVAALLPAVLVGSLFFGVGNAAVMLSRYAGASGVHPATRVSAIAAVLVATTVGAVLGPLFLGPADGAGQALGLPPLAGCYVAGAAGMGVAAACFAVFGRRTSLQGRSPDTDTDTPDDDDLAPTERRRDTMVGVSVLALANVVMVGVMTALPLHLMHLHADLSVVGVIISLHIAAMFAPSPVSAALVRRLGAEGTAVAAGTVLAAATAVVASGSASVIAIGAGVLLVGWGWNLALVAGSAILTRSAPERLRLRREGWGEVGMGAAAAGGGAASGIALQLTGFATLALCGCGAAVILVGVAALASRRKGIATRAAAVAEDQVGRRAPG